MNTDKCIFCEAKEIIIENEFAYVRFDKFPVNLGHLEVITKRHVASFFDATLKEKLAIIELLDRSKEIIDNKYKPDGYNIGINCGEVAGQSIMHLHVHLIPRYKDDVKNPRGGVRGVIPSKQNY